MIEFDTPFVIPLELEEVAPFYWLVDNRKILLSRGWRLKVNHG